ncbi:MAG: proteasome accessory factor PafA2 family protein, partial [Myxococcales bacterium]|nr:proteasome accessory factor PafA2 family protein [Myxococcales bacterium]
MLACFILLVVFGLLGLLVLVLARRHEDTLMRVFVDDRDYLGAFMRMATAIGVVGTAPGMLAYAGLWRLCCCRAIRRDALAFLISRPAVSGTGTLDPETGRFGLSEKGPAIRRLVRMSSLPTDRCVFDIGNLMKPLFCVMDLELRPLASLFRRRQRLQLGLSDSNLAQTAEYLKVATTTLVFDLAEAGVLARLPRPRRPLSALRRLIGDPELRSKVPCSDGVARSAIELQRLYLDAAREHVAGAAAASLEVHELLRRWDEVLTALESQPALLFGRLDWVSKRALLEQAGAGLEFAARKKIDLKYHELGTGYFARLEDEGLAPRLVGDDEIERALLEAPERSPARRRSQLLRSLAASGIAARIGWDRIEIPKGSLRKQVIRLDDYRR